jgi:hypothetical protein
MQDEMAGERSPGGVLAGAGGGTGAGVPGLLALLLAMEAGVPVPVPSDLVMLLLGERVSAGARPLWLAAAALEAVAPAGPSCPASARAGPARPGRGAPHPPGPGPGSPVGERGRPGKRGCGVVHNPPGPAGEGDAAVGRVLPALVVGHTTPGLRTVTVVAAAGSGIRVGRALPALGSSLFLQWHLLVGYALGPAARELLEQARMPVLMAAALLLRRGRPGRPDMKERPASLRPGAPRQVDGATRPGWRRSGWWNAAAPTCWGSRARRAWATAGPARRRASRRSSQATCRSC